MTNLRTWNQWRAPGRCLALAITVLHLLSGCGAPVTEPEQALRDWISRGVAAAEAKERRALLDMISPAYADARGNRRDDIDDILRIYFLRMNRIELITSVEEISVIGDSVAEIVLQAGMAGTHDGVLGFSADAYRFVFELEKKGSEWLLISARWGEWGKELR
jgi:hypothetical protein